MSYALDLMREEYIALRAEICQSIAKQHQITLAGYGLTAAVFGYVVGMEHPTWEALSVIPFVLLTMTSLWTVECNRMVRASYYIGYVLWPEMKNAAELADTVGWETWIRKEGGNANSFRKRQHHLQLFVAAIVPVVITVAILWLVSLSLWSRFSLGVVAICFVVIALWIYVIWQVRKVSDLAAVVPGPSKKNGELPLP